MASNVVISKHSIVTPDIKTELLYPRSGYDFNLNFEMLKSSLEKDIEMLYLLLIYNENDTSRMLNPSIIGYGLLYKHKNSCTRVSLKSTMEFYKSGQIWLEFLDIKELYQCNGYGSYLIKAITEDYPVVYLDSLMDAVGFYEKHHFHIIEESDDGYFMSNVS